MIVDLTRVLEKKTAEILDHAKQLLDKMHTNLKQIYHKELQPNHRPSFWNPHKKRHLEKTQMATLMNQKLNKGFKSLEEVECYLFLHEGQKIRNFFIDKKGGRFGRILNAQDHELHELQSELMTLHSVRKEIHFWTRKIINHYIALEKEAYVEDEVNLNAKDLIELKSCHDVHIQQIDIAQKYLQRIMQEYEGENFIQDFMKTLNETLDEINNQTLREMKNDNRNERRNRLYQSRVAYLRTIDKAYEQHALKENIFTTLGNANSLLESPIQLLVRMFAMDSLLNQFLNETDLNAKVLFWDLILKSLNRPNEYLLGTNRKIKKDAWFRACYSGKDKDKLFHSDEIKDPFHLEDLSRDLKSINFHNIDDSLYQELDKAMHNYIQKQLIRSKSNFSINDDYKASAIKTWIQKLEVDYEKFKNKIDHLQTVIYKWEKNQPLNELSLEEMALLDLVQTVADSINHLPFDAKPKQTTATIYNFFSIPDETKSRAQIEMATESIPNFLTL